MAIISYANLRGVNWRGLWHEYPGRARRFACLRLRSKPHFVEVLRRYDRTELWEKAYMGGCEHMDSLENKCTRYKPGILRATTNM